MQGRDAEGITYTGVVGSEGGRDVYDARTVVCRDVIVGDEAEGAVAGVEPGDELLVREPD